MLKKLLLLSIVVALIAGAGLAYAVYRADALARYFQPQLERLASEATGSKVSLEGLDVSLFPQTAIEIEKVSLSRSPEEALELRNFLLDIDLLPLFSKRLEIVRARLEQPSITLIKDARGVQVAGLTPAEKSPAPSRPSAEKAKETKREAAQQGLSINLEEFAVENGKVTYRDTVAGTEHVISDLDVTAALELDSSSIRVPAFTVSGSVAPLEKFSVDGSNASFSPDSGKLDIPTAKLTTPPAVFALSGAYETKAKIGNAALTSDAIDLAQAAGLAAKVSPNIGAYGIAGRASTSIEAEVEGSDVSAQGSLTLSEVSAKAGSAAVSGLAGDISLRATLAEQSAASKSLSLSLNGSPINAAFEARAKGKTVDLTKLAIRAFGGTVEGSAGFRDGAISSDIALAGLNVGESLRALTGSPDSKITGTLERATVNLSGPPSPTALSGHLTVSLRDGRLEGQNLAATVLKGITELPFVKGALFGAAAGEEEVERDATVIRRLTGSFSLTGGRASTKDLILVSDIFELRGEGSVGVDSSVDMNATIYFEKEFSARLAGKVKELRQILDSDGRLVIPLSLSGTPPKIVVVPNVSKLMQLGAGRAIRDEAGKAIDKALGGKGGEGKKILEGILGGF